MARSQDAAGSGNGRVSNATLRVIGYYVPSAIAILTLLLAWQLLVVWFGVKEFILPTPLAALERLFDPKYRWGYNFLVTTTAIVGGFVISAALGIALAIAVVWNSVLERTILPILVLFNTLPKIALAPLFVIWMGYGVWPNIMIAVTVAFFPVVINTAAGLASVEPELLDLVRVLKASKWKVFRKIRFPNALPHIFTGLKLNATLAVIGAIVGEFVASEAGLGALIVAGGVTLDTPGIFASLLLISFLGLGFYGLVMAAERIATPWEFRPVAGK
jgi:NitT/TauT family transport system permease protein